MRRSFTDMMGRVVDIPFPPKRIISVVPSQTELLYDLGLDEEVVGVTKFCVHPERWFRSKTRIGGTKQLNLDKIRELQPDLIIANKEENTKEQIEALAAEYPVWISDIHTLDEALRMITGVGEITGKVQAAENIIAQVQQGFGALSKASQARRVAYFIWYRPWMSVGTDTFISNMIETIGWQNVFADKQRYPEVDLSELVAANPELVLLSSEPFPFKEKHIQEIKAVLPDAIVLLVDGELFSWYGSRMLKAGEYFNELI
ncbi:MAG: cobalamin-binding protein [Sphingobacteriales bacterium]|nr:MAG: cobalamin-binding protein [Sphingobacteriales bacterium]